MPRVLKKENEKLVIPLFTSHYSKGRSILSLADPKKTTEGGPDSIINLCLENNIKNPFLVENNLTGLAEALRNFKSSGVDFRFGWKTTIVNDVNATDKKSTASKIIIFIKNTQGYYDLIKVHNSIHKCHDGLCDHGVLQNLWTDNLLLALPFYDSYIFNNLLCDSSSLPNVKPFDPIFFREDNDLPFDRLVAERLPKGRVVDAKSIYYNKRKDFVAWQTYRCLCDGMNKGKRRSINLPMFDHCCSREFCLESWKEQLTE